MSSGLELSVAICTCGRPSLQQVLEGLGSCDGAGEPGWEVVVVDNRPSVDTEALVGSFRAKLPIHYVAEPQPGSSSARNRCVIASRGETIWYLDDDVRLTQNWLLAIRSAIRMHPEAAFFGGKLLPEWGTTTFPKWFRGEVCGRVGHGTMAGLYDYGDVERILAPDEIVIEANMGIRRRVFAEVGGFRADMGILPDKPRGFGEGPDLIVRARSRGGIGLYVPGAMAHHLILADRYTVGYALRWACSMGRFAQKTKALYHMRAGRHSTTYRILEVARNAIRVVTSLPAPLFFGWFVDIRHRVEYWMTLAWSLGRMAESFAVKPGLSLDWPELLKELKE